MRIDYSRIDYKYGKTGKSPIDVHFIALLSRQSLQTCLEIELIYFYHTVGLSLIT